MGRKPGLAQTEGRQRRSGRADAPGPGRPEHRVGDLPASVQLGRRSPARTLGAETAVILPDPLPSVTPREDQFARDGMARVETTTLLPGGMVATLTLRRQGERYTVEDEGSGELRWPRSASSTSHEQTSGAEPTSRTVWASPSSATRSGLPTSRRRNFRLRSASSQKHVGSGPRSQRMSSTKRANEML